MNERYVRCGGAVQRFRVFSVAVTCVIATAFWTPPATGEEDHGTNGDAAEKHAGGGHHDYNNGHEVWIYGVNFEVMF